MLKIVLAVLLLSSVALAEEDEQQTIIMLDTVHGGGRDRLATLDELNAAWLAKWKPCVAGIRHELWSLSMKVTAAGKMTLTLVEPLTKEKLAEVKACIVKSLSTGTLSKASSAVEFVIELKTL